MKRRYWIIKLKSYRLYKLIYKDYEPDKTKNQFIKIIKNVCELKNKNILQYNKYEREKDIYEKTQYLIFNDCHYFSYFISQTNYSKYRYVKQNIIYLKIYFPHFIM